MYFKAVKTIVRDLGWHDPGLHFARGFNGFFTGFNPHCQKMFTHFAHAVVDENDDHWLVERSDKGVVMVYTDTSQNYKMQMMQISASEGYDSSFESVGGNDSCSRIRCFCG